MVNLAFGQHFYSLSGQVLEPKTREPLPFVNVYFQGSTIGTQTDLKGNFTIANVPAGKYRLVASMVGFVPNIQVIVLNENLKGIKIALEEDIKALNELKILGKRDKDWERNFKEFSTEFLGQNFKKKDVVIKNKEVVNFERNDTTLRASANEPLVVENNLLGYRLYYILENFEKGGNHILFTGIPRFEILTPKDEKQQKYWEKNRRAAYNGSLKHLFKSILYGQLKEQNFQCQYLRYDPDNHLYNERKGDDGKALNFVDSNVVYKTNIENVFVLDFPHRLFTKYWNGNRWLERSILKQKIPIEVDEKGNIFDPNAVEIDGDLALRRTGNLLPFDFEISNNFGILGIELDSIPAILENIYKEPREKVEALNLQKFYFAGEKLIADFQTKYLINDNNSLISIPLYVDLINLDKGTLIRHFKLKLVESQVKFEYQIPRDLESGNYQLRAYTNWMKNYSEEGFGKFDFTIFSGNFESEIPQDLEAELDTIIIHIEGNSELVLNLKSRILIEAKDNFGHPIAINYEIVNSLNEEILSSEIDSLGLDFIEFTPKLIDKYSILADGKTFKFPNIQPKGTILSIDNLSNPEKIRVWIQNNGSVSDSLYFTIVKNGKLDYVKTLTNKQKSYIFQVEKPDFASTFSAVLYDKNFKAIAERLILTSDSVDNTFLEENKKSFANKPSKSYYYNRRFDNEKYLTITGKVENKNGKILYRNVNLALLLKSQSLDSLDKSPLIYETKTDSLFLMDSLDFFGTKQLFYFCNGAVVKIDTSNLIPEIRKEKRPIDWNFVANFKQDSMLLSRLANINIISDLPKNQQKSDTLNTNFIGKSKPFLSVNSEKINQFKNTQELLDFLKNESKCSGQKSILLLNKLKFNFENEPLKNFPISMTESINVFKCIDTNATNCECIFKINLKNQVRVVPNQNSFTFEGYYR